MRKLGLTALIAISSLASDLELRKFDWDSYIIGRNDAGGNFLDISRTDGNHVTQVWATGPKYEQGFIKKEVVSEKSTTGKSCTWGDVATLRDEYQKSHMNMEVDLYKTRPCTDNEMMPVIDLLYRAPALRKQSFSYNTSPVRSHVVRIEKKNDRYEIQNYHEELAEQIVIVNGKRRGQIGYREITNYRITGRALQIKSFVAAGGLGPSHKCTDTATKEMAECPVQLIDNLYGNYNALMKDLRPLMK